MTMLKLPLLFAEPVPTWLAPSKIVMEAVGIAVPVTVSDVLVWLNPLAGEVIVGGGVPLVGVGVEAVVTISTA
jgi:hypothetical protein